MANEGGLALHNLLSQICAKPKGVSMKEGGDSSRGSSESTDGGRSAIKTLQETLLGLPKAPKCKHGPLIVFAEGEKEDINSLKHILSYLQ